jgi:aldose 1-epimerase
MVALEEGRFADGDLEIVVLPGVGARIHRLRAYGTDLMRTPSDPATHLDDPFFWGGYVMAPWGGRIAAAPTEVAGRVVDLPSNFPDGTAIHGLVYDTAWEREDEHTFVVRGGGDGGWPWPFETRLAFAIDSGRIRIDQAVINRADEAMPAGLGLHPWFSRPLEVAFAADTVYVSNLDSTPTAEHVVGPHDLRAMAPMADDLDATWSALGDPPVRMRWPATGLGLTMRADGPSLHIVAASPRAVDAVAIEPQTHAPQAIRRLLAGEPGALTMLGPGQALELATEIAVDRIEASAGP